MKNNLLYYQHDADADSHPRFKALRARFGWAGEGRFWAINNRIARSNECRLNLSTALHLAALADELDLSPEELVDLLGFLSDPGKCGLLVKEPSPENCQTSGETAALGWYTTDRVQQSLSSVMRERGAASDRYHRRKRTSGENGTPAAQLRPKTDTEQSRAEQSKEEEERRAPAREDPPVDGSGAPPGAGPQFQLAHDWGRRYFEKTTVPFVPIEEHYAQAAKLLRVLGGDLARALEASRRYFDEGGWWFTEDKRTGKRSYSFGSFCANASEILASNGRQGGPGPPPRVCPVCGCRVVGSMQSCGECGMEVSKFADPEAVEEQKRWRQKRLETSRRSAQS